jgi:hypothetical protein
MELFIPSIEDIENEKVEAASSALHWKQIKQATNEKLNTNIQSNNSSLPTSEINNVNTPSKILNNNTSININTPIKNTVNAGNNPINSATAFRPASEIVRLGKRIQIPMIKPQFNNKYMTESISSEITTEKSTETVFEDSNERIIIKSTEKISEKVTVTSNENSKNPVHDRFPASPVGHKGKPLDSNANQTNNNKGCSLVISERQVD